MTEKPLQFVLDSFALMAYYQREPGGARTRELLEDAHGGQIGLSMTTVNLGEIAYLLERRRGLEQAQAAIATLYQEPVELVEVDRLLALSAARIKIDAGMGYADCFSAALAQRMGATLVTGDPDFRQVEHLVAIEWLPTGG